MPWFLKGRRHGASFEVTCRTGLLIVLPKCMGLHKHRKQWSMFTFCLFKEPQKYPFKKMPNTTLWKTGKFKGNNCENTFVEFQFVSCSRIIIINYTWHY